MAASVAAGADAAPLPPSLEQCRQRVNSKAVEQDGCIWEREQEGCKTGATGGARGTGQASGRLPPACSAGHHDTARAVPRGRPGLLLVRHLRLEGLLPADAALLARRRRLPAKARPATAAGATAARRRARRRRWLPPRLPRGRRLQVVHGWHAASGPCRGGHELAQLLVQLLCMPCQVSLCAVPLQRQRRDEQARLGGDALQLGDAGVAAAAQRGGQGAGQARGSARRCASYPYGMETASGGPQTASRLRRAPAATARALQPASQPANMRQLELGPPRQGASPAQPSSPPATLAHMRHCAMLAAQVRQ